MAQRAAAAWSRDFGHWSRVGITCAEHFAAAADSLANHSTMPKNTLYVTGFTKETKAADLAPDFEKYVYFRSLPPVYRAC